MARHRTSDFDYSLPRELIAQRPAADRSASRLLVLHKESGTVEHRRFIDITKYLGCGDVLVLNDTRVIPARLMGVRRRTGGKVEVLLTESRDPSRRRWQALIKTRGTIEPGECVDLGDGHWIEAAQHTAGMEWDVLVHSRLPTGAMLDAVGLPPLPPYIAQDANDSVRRQEDLDRYQTVYARSDGAVAAPTAGLHFTPEILRDLAAQRVETVPVTLHVGLGTFLPVKTEYLEDHPMHREEFHVTPGAGNRIRAALAEGRRVVAVGTTSCRVLETLDWMGTTGAVSGSTKLFIYPPYEFRAVAALLTNFHLPKSTLLALVTAFAGMERTMAAYHEAVEKRYRFYSYGDAMLIL